MKSLGKEIKNGMNRIFLGIGVLLLVVGVIMIYDARPIVKMYFSFGEENEATLGMKILGFVLAIIGGILFFYNF